MKNLLLLCVLALAGVTACNSLAAHSTPDDIKSIPQSQSVALEVAIEKIEANDPAWVDASGNVQRSSILAVLKADKEAWDELDRFYNE